MDHRQRFTRGKGVLKAFDRGEADSRAGPPATDADGSAVPNLAAAWSEATKMKTLIVHYHNFELWHAPSWIRERLQQDFPDHRFIQFQNYEQVPEELADT